MIGSIGADNRYSTKYNNLKSNRESDKWGGTLTQTVDKNTSSRADVNRAKKSTAMDSYLVLSGNGVNNLKQAYSQYESENYRIVPDNEAGCFDIYNKDGERLGAFSYSDIKIRQDEITGKQFLISEHGTMNYDALVLDDELKDALQNVMDKDALDVETLQGFTLNIHSFSINESISIWCKTTIPFAFPGFLHPAFHCLNTDVLTFNLCHC